MIEAFAAAFCAFGGPSDLRPDVDCEATTIALLRPMQKAGTDNPEAARFLDLMVRNMLLITPVPEVRLKIDAGDADATVFIFRDGSVLPSENPPPPNLTCQTPCDIVVNNITEAGVAFYLEGDGLWTPALSFSNADEAEWIDGMATYSMSVDMRKETLRSQTWRMAEKFGGDPNVSCEGADRPLVQDAAAEACHRVPPAMPPDATRSGYCDVLFDVSSDGTPQNINAQVCSDDIFRDSSEMSVGYWRYKPAKKDGRFVREEGVRSKITFRLADVDGNIIPE